MPVLPNDAIRNLLAPFVASELPEPLPELLPELLPESLIDQLSIYLDLLVRWNARVSLTSIRSPEEIVQRHFGESLFTAQKLSKHLKNGSKLLDYGSGAGFPGLPIQLYLPHIRVTLAESQARKVSFLHEVTRTLALPTEVWPKRVEEMEPRLFDTVTLRAVDRMPTSIQSAASRVGENGWMAILAGREMEVPPEAKVEEFAIPASEYRRLLILRIVPRGTIL
jgi:16S rRNA (guanine527-N7)-methyltransferase